MRKSQGHDVFRVEAARLHQPALAVHERHALANVGERQAVSLALVLLLAHWVAHDYRDEARAELPGNGHRPAAGLRLDAVIDRVLQQRLQHQPGDQRVAGECVDAPGYRQPRAQPQLLDALIDARDFQLLLQRDDVALLAQVGAKQVGQILHRLLGLRRIGAGQRSDRVHAVEQEVRADSSLQRVYPRLGAHLDAAPPLQGHIEVTQRERRHDEADRHIAHQEGPRLGRKQAFRSRIPGPLRTPERVGAGGDQRDQYRHQQQNRRRAACDAQAPQEGAQPAQQSRAGQPDPQEEQGGARQIRPEADVETLPGERQDQGGELGNEDDRERRTRLADVRQVEGSVAAP